MLGVAQKTRKAMLKSPRIETDPAGHRVLGIHTALGVQDQTEQSEARRQETMLI